MWSASAQPTTFRLARSMTRGQVGPALPGGAAGDVADVAGVEHLGGSEVALDEVEGLDLGGGVLDGGLTPALLATPFQPVEAHQASNPAPPAGHTTVKQFPVHPRRPISLKSLQKCSFVADVAEVSTDTPENGRGSPRDRKNGATLQLRHAVAVQCGCSNILGTINLKPGDLVPKVSCSHPGERNEHYFGRVNAFAKEASDAAHVPEARLPVPGPASTPILVSVEAAISRCGPDMPSSQFPPSGRPPNAAVYVECSILTDGVLRESTNQHLCISEKAGSGATSVS